METVKQHNLMQERDALLERNKQLEVELHEFVDKAIYDDDNYSISDDERCKQVVNEIAFNAKKIETINSKLDMYDVIADCYDEFCKWMKKEFDISRTRK